MRMAGQKITHRHSTCTEKAKRRVLGCEKFPSGTALLFWPISVSVCISIKMLNVRIEMSTSSVLVSQSISQSQVRTFCVCETVNVLLNYSTLNLRRQSECSVNTWQATCNFNIASSPPFFLSILPLHCQSHKFSFIHLCHSYFRHWKKQSRIFTLPCLWVVKVVPYSSAANAIICETLLGLRVWNIIANLPSLGTSLIGSGALSFPFSWWYRSGS